MTAQREVRVADSFFSQLDAQLGAERGPQGQPSRHDFLVLDLPAVIEVFATSFDELPCLVDDVRAARSAVGAGITVRTYAVHGLDVAGDVLLLGIDLELWPHEVE